VSINTPEELASMRAAGSIVRRMIEAMKRAVRPGVTTAELDEVGASVMREHGAQSAPQLVYKFPGVNCISLNEEAVHGIPGERAVQEGDLVKLDVTIEKDGFMADAAETVAVARFRKKASGLWPVLREPSTRPCWWREPASVSQRSVASWNARYVAAGFR